MTAPSYLCLAALPALPGPRDQRARAICAKAEHHGAGVRFLTAVRGYVQLDPVAYAIRGELQLGRSLGRVDPAALDALEARAAEPAHTPGSSPLREGDRVSVRLVPGGLPRMGVVAVIRGAWAGVTFRERHRGDWIVKTVQVPLALLREARDNDHA